MPWFLMISLMLLAGDTNISGGDDIIGSWVTAKGNAKIQVYRVGSKYFGKIAWMKEPSTNGKPKLDSNNPDAGKRSNPILGLQILTDFVYKNNEWISGEIYDPESGKTYSCKITMPDNNTLKVRGYIGISLFGRTEVWKRG